MIYFSQHDEKTSIGSNAAFTLNHDFLDIVVLLAIIQIIHNSITSNLNQLDAYLRLYFCSFVHRVPIFSLLMSCISFNISNRTPSYKTKNRMLRHLQI